MPCQARGHAPLAMTDTGEAAPQPHAGRATVSWRTPGVRGIGAASLLADVGHEVPTALLPSLLTSTLGAPAAALRYMAPDANRPEYRGD